MSWRLRDGSSRQMLERALCSQGALPSAPHLIPFLGTGKWDLRGAKRQPSSLIYQGRAEEPTPILESSIPLSPRRVFQNPLNYRGKGFQHALAMGLALSGGSGALGYRVWPGPPWVWGAVCHSACPVLGPWAQRQLRFSAAGGVDGGESMAGTGTGCR